MARLPVSGGDQGTWGDILNEYLSQVHRADGTLKDNSVTASTIAPGAVTKTTIGLGNVNNTADADKPVSTAQQAALAAKLATTDLDAQTAAKINDNASATAEALSTAYVPRWKATTAYTVGDVVIEPGGLTVKATIAHTSGTTYSGTNWTIVGSVTSHAALTGLNNDDHPQYLNNARGTTLATNLDDAAVLRNALGSKQGAAVSPWKQSPTLGAEMWTLANMQTGGGYNSTSLAPSITANSTAQTLKTRINMGTLANQDQTYRLEFDYDLSTINAGGWGGISLLLTDSASNLIGGTTQQRVVNRESPRVAGRFIFDFKPRSGGTTYFEVRLEVANNATAGTLSISNVSLRLTGDVTRPMLVSKEFSTGSFPLVYWQQREAATGIWKTAALAFQSDGSLPNAYGSVSGAPTDAPWRWDPADPEFARPALSVIDRPGNQEELNAGYTSLRAMNNDQIIEVWNGTTWELRGNTHGGEFARGAATYKIDQGAGFVPWALTHGLDPVWRFQVSIPTEMRRSVDGTTPFCNVDHTFTVFRDGMIRCDRTTTFLVATRVKSYFEWMSSHDTATPYLGRIGKGAEPFASIDTHPKVSTPATPTVTTATTGGTLAAGTYSYRVAALSAYGETVASTAATVTTTGTTSTATISWTSVASATGYAVYGRVAGVERLLGRTVTTSWTDDGMAVSTTPPLVASTAWLYNNSTALDSAHSTDASWAVFREPRNGWCYGNIYDRESPLSRPQVAQVRTRLEAGSAIQKNYANLCWSGGVDDITIPAGTAWSATHYSYTYLPFDPAQYHREIAIRAASLSALGALYPSI